MVNNQNVFNNIYQGKRVLVTGHTGFKGSWLTLWLLELGANVAGYSAYIPSNPSNFQVLKLQNKINHYIADTRDFESMKNVFNEFRPQIIFHLASQPIVRHSYDEPKLTFDSNLGGAVNVLECVKHSSSVEAVVVITSDKCYRNVEWEYGYREDDELGGDDPYSASKACVEIACRAYYQSFFKFPGSPKIATTRAGNVIGGGDWAEARIVPDCVRAWSKGHEPIIRNPEATRPWQHVLEPLSGYLWLGCNLLQYPEKHSGEAYNFGPNSTVVESVGTLVNLFTQYWDKAKWEHKPDGNSKHEASLLKLCCDKALFKLNWQASLSFHETIKLTAEWYKTYYDQKIEIYDFTSAQLYYYINKAKEKDQPWTK